MSDYCVAISTCGSEEDAKILARAVVEAKLAACVQMMPINSVYAWKGEVAEEGEVLLLMKTRSAAVDELRDFVVAKHSYEVPEFVTVPIESGFAPYLNWIDDQTK